MSAVYPTILDRLLDRWQEVADAYKPGDLPWDDIDRKYRDQRLIYLRNIRDLRHVLDTGQMPCSLMNDEERGRGDCGHIHDDPRTTDAPPAERVTSVIVAHICHLLLDQEAHGDHAARDLTWALKNAGVDLSGPIRDRITDLTLGRDPSDPPF